MSRIAKATLISLMWLTVGTFTFGHVGEGIKLAEFTSVAGFAFAVVATILIVRLRP